MKNKFTSIGWLYCYIAINLLIGFGFQDIAIADLAYNGYCQAIPDPILLRSAQGIKSFWIFQWLPIMGGLTIFGGVAVVAFRYLRKLADSTPKQRAVEADTIRLAAIIGTGAAVVVFACILWALWHLAGIAAYLHPDLTAWRALQCR